jgi:NitT/TauT family transport system permease protein
MQKASPIQQPERLAQRVMAQPPTAPRRWWRAPAVNTVGSFVLLLAGWQALVTIGRYERFLLPGPRDVWQELRLLIADGRLQHHATITISQVIPGVLLGCLFAAVLGYILAKSPVAQRLVAPWLVASQAVPIIAIAPLLTLWVPSTYWSRVLVAVLVVFFPVLINVITGLRSVSAELYELMHSLRATRWQIFRWLELPAALPILLGGLRIGATLSVIGTLVGEFVQPRNAGLGFLLVTARYQFKTAQVFVVLITLATITLTLYALVTLLERHLLRWQQQARGITGM